MALHITGDEHADQVLSSDPFALLVGMMLDQQYPMEHAFRGPAKVLDRFGIAVRAGHHCTMPLHERLDLAATARASFQVYSTRDDIDALCAGLVEVQRVFGS